MIASPMLCDVRVAVRCYIFNIKFSPSVVFLRFFYSFCCLKYQVYGGLRLSNLDDNGVSNGATLAPVPNAQTLPSFFK